MMSLKLFFNRKGAVVSCFAVAGWFLIIWNLSRLPSEGNEGGVLTVTFLVLFVLFCFFITITRFFPWYPKAFRGCGIEEHFEKTIVPTSYMMVATAIVYHLWESCWPFLAFAGLLLTIIISVNFILLYFHFRDQDPLPPSYFTQNLHENIK